MFGENAPLQAIRDRVGHTVTLTWSQTNAFGSGFGNILRITSPNGRWIAFTYDGANRIIEATDHINRTVEYEYDASGRVLDSPEPARSASGASREARASGAGAPRAA